MVCTLCSPDSGGTPRFAAVRAALLMPSRCSPQLQGVPEAEARHFFQQLIVALAYTHRVGIANRDIKVLHYAPITVCALCLRPCGGLVLEDTSCSACRPFCLHARAFDALPRRRIVTATAYLNLAMGRAPIEMTPAVCCVAQAQP